MFNRIILIVVMAISTTFALNNGIGRTPPMGWSSWNAFRVNINENLVKAMADSFVSKGMKAAGYTYVNIDDGWGSGRDGNGNVTVHTVRFPSGMLSLANYIHGKGLLAGIYTDAGSITCGTIYDNEQVGNWGAYGHYTSDMQLFLLTWGYDYIKVDWCGGDAMQLSQVTQYTQLRDAILATGKPVFYNVCCWQFPGAWVTSVGNSWRTDGDITPSFTKVMSNVETQNGLAQYAGPGQWNDPDMMVVGMGMTPNEDRAHFTMWSILCAPLIAGNDLRSMSDTTKAILTNREIIALNQDSLGIPATRIRDDGNQEVFRKPLRYGKQALILLNKDNAAVTMSFTRAEAGIQTDRSAHIILRNLWTKTDVDELGATFSISVPAHSVVALLATGVDTTKPTLTNAVARIDSPTKIRLEFSEPLDPISATTIGNYTVTPGVTIVGVVQANDSAVVLTAAQPLTSGITYTVAVSNVKDHYDAAPNTIVPGSSKTFVMTGYVPGLIYEYFEWPYTQVNFRSVEELNGLTPKSTGIATTITITGNSLTDFFGERFSGYINIPANGSYTFYTKSDEGSKLFIDGSLVVSNDSLRDVVTTDEKSGTITLTQGYHSILCTYFERWGSEYLTVSWQSGSISKQTIPASVLFNTGVATPVVKQSGVQHRSRTVNSVIVTGPVITVVGSGSYAINIFNLEGKHVKTIPGNGNALYQLTPKELKPGCYVVQCSGLNVPEQRIMMVP